MIAASSGLIVVAFLAFISFPFWFSALCLGIARSKENKAIREGRPEEAYINIAGTDHRRSKLSAFLIIFLYGRHTK